MFPLFGQERFDDLPGIDDDSERRANETMGQRGPVATGNHAQIFDVTNVFVFLRK
jgi:hypothetical protein